MLARIRQYVNTFSEIWAEGTGKSFLYGQGGQIPEVEKDIYYEICEEIPPGRKSSCNLKGILL